MGEAGRGVLTGFVVAALVEVECFELDLGLLWVVFDDVARVEAVATLCESMVFFVAQGSLRGGLFHQGRDFPTFLGAIGR